MVEFIFRPVRHYRRVTALKKRLGQISRTTAKAAGFTVLIATSE